MVVLSIGGLDPSGGAGILQDSLTIQDLGGRAMAVSTAWTVQSSRGVQGWDPVPPDSVARQVRAVLDDFPVSAVKIGMIGTGAHADALARTLAERALPVVLDPVLRASLGGALGDVSLAEGIRRLLPVSRLVTPNLDEAGALLGHPVRDLDGMAAAAAELVRMGAQAALVKGGHLAGDPSDVLADAEGVTEFAGERVGDGVVHGTGCVLSSAIGFFLASGLPVRRAVGLARDYLTRRLRGAKHVGKGPLAYL